MTFRRASLFKWVSLIGASCLFITGCNFLNNQVQAEASNIDQLFQITDNRISEASGIAVSRIDEQVLWINNDSGNPNTIYAVSSEGEFRGSLTLKGVENRDWEDVASFVYKGKSYLLVADVGDNGESNLDYTIHIVPEPVLAGAENSEFEIEPEWSITFDYPDGKHDSEAVAVDIQRQKIVLLTKREDIPKLFELPLLPTGEDKIVAIDLGEIRPIPDVESKGLSIISLLDYSTMPTGMDISADGKNIVVVTYEGIYLYPNPDGQTWDKVMSKAPVEMALPNLKQAEAIGFDQSGMSVYVTSEKIPAPLYKFDIPSAN